MAQQNNSVTLKTIVMIYKITKVLPALLILAVLILVSSCNDSSEPIPNSKVDLTEEEAIEILMEIVANREKASSFNEAKRIDGKTPEDFFREWQQNTRNTHSRAPIPYCEDTPPCPKADFSNPFNFSVGCDIEYSFQLYNCGTGDAAIFNFQMAPAAGSNCPVFDILVTQNYNQGDLTEYQRFYNIFAALILSDIEDTLFPAVQQSTVGNTLIASYISNICAVACQSDGPEAECGMDCCVRFAVFNNTTGIRTSTSVFSAAECGGNSIPCDINGQIQLEDCKNFDCIELGSYIPS